MKFLPLLGLPVVSATSWGPSPTFDCAMRKLAYTYGKQLVPRMGSFESLYYALDLNDPTCPPTAMNASSSAAAASDGARPLPAGAKLYVDPTAGSDKNVGAMASPLLTIQAALDKAAAMEPTPAVVLRHGTHYIKETLLLTPSHSNLHLIGYPGETATVSGGVELTGISWTPYNVTPTPPPSPSPPAGKWTVQDGYNYVFDYEAGDPNFPTLGTPDNKDDCEKLCQADAKCSAYTWHDEHQGSYAKRCVGRLDGHFEAHAQGGHFSGHDSAATPSSGPSPTPSPPAGPPNVYVTDVKDDIGGVMGGLQLDGERATIARYPNQPGGVETSCGYGCMVASGDATWTPPNFNKYGNVTYYTDMIPAHKRNDSAAGGGLDNWFSHYMIGVNGLCSVYDPPVSYWCSEHTSGGGAFAFRTPSGVTPKPGALPHSPYSDVSQALLFVWRPARWANWMFEVGSYAKENNTYAFGKGGNQGARGNDKGGDFYIQNVFEELDYPGEYFFNRTTKKLYLWYNGTGAPPATTTFVVPHKQQLVASMGTQWNPVKNIKMTNVVYTAAAPTYMERHGVPSAGDWALDRFAAVFLQGTEGVVIDNCTFTRLDGNAVMVSGYNRNATVQNSDFSYIGGNGIAAWGYTNETATDPGRPGVALVGYPEAGVDGTDGEHPRYTTVTGNTIREVGLYEKQSSFFIQAKTAQSTILGNVFFNGPRAGINANDGFGGGDDIGHNLVFSSCRESGDHGPFNSWDRQVRLSTARISLSLSLSLSL